MYEDILVPVDGSEGATEILHHIAAQAQYWDATVHLLFVADTTRDSVTVIDADVVDTLVTEGEAIVEDAAATLASHGVDYETDVVQGNPAPTIIEYIQRYQHDLIVLPTHGRTGVSRYLVGSVTEKVVRLSPKPVLTARMQPDEELRFPYESVLIPTDGSHGAEAGAEHGLRLAAALGATVHILGVAETASLGPDVRSVFSDTALETAAGEAVDDLGSLAEQRGLSDVRQHVVRGDPAEQISNTIDENKIDVVTMGRTGRRGIDRILLGSVAERTVRSAPVPVITVGQEG
jgi:nucleotide-binding universal stress UspA family protein